MPDYDPLGINATTKYDPLGLDEELKTPSLKKKLWDVVEPYVGIGESALSQAGGMGAFFNPIPGLAGIVHGAKTAIQTGSLDKALEESTKMIEAQQEALQPWQPMTESGKSLNEMINLGISKGIVEPLDIAGGIVAENIAKKVDPFDMGYGPYIGGGVGGLGKAAAELYSMGKLFGIPKTAKTLLRKPQAITPEGIRQAAAKVPTEQWALSPEDVDINRVGVAMRDKWAETDIRQQQRDTQRLLDSVDTSAIKDVTDPNAAIWQRGIQPEKGIIREGRLQAIAETFDSLRKKGFSNERIKEIMDELYPPETFEGAVPEIKGVKPLTEIPTPEQIEASRTSQTLPEGQKSWDVTLPTKEEVKGYGGVITEPIEKMTTQDILTKWNFYEQLDKSRMAEKNRQYVAKMIGVLQDEYLDRTGSYPEPVKLLPSRVLYKQFKGATPLEVPPSGLDVGEQITVMGGKSGFEAPTGQPIVPGRAPTRLKTEPPIPGLANVLKPGETVEDVLARKKAPQMTQVAQKAEEIGIKAKYTEPIRENIVNEIEQKTRGLTDELARMPVEQYKLTTSEQQELIKRGMMFDVDRMGKPQVGVSQATRIKGLREKVTGEKPTGGKTVGEKSLYSIVNEEGLNSAKLQKDYNFQEDIIQNGLLGLMRKKGGRALDDYAATLQERGILGATPDDFPGAGDYLLKRLQEERQERKTKVTQKLTIDEKEVIKNIAEEMKNEGSTPEEIRSTLEAIQRDTQEEINLTDFESKAREVENLLEKGFIPEAEEIPLLTEGKQTGLFTEKEAPFTLAGKQPYNPKTMKPGMEKKGERMFEGEVKKATAEELAERKKYPPGAQRVEEPQIQSDIAQFTSILESMEKEKLSTRARLDLTQGVREKIDKAGDSLSRTFSGIKQSGSVLWDIYKNPPKWGKIEDIAGDLKYALTKSTMENSEFTRRMQKVIPDKTTGEAISIYMQADGDRVIMQRWVDLSAKNPNTTKYTKAYQKALNLTGEQKRIAEQAREYYDSRWEQAQNAGILDTWIDNYINQIWGKDPELSTRLRAEVSTGLLNANPSFAKKRIFGSYFEGEQMGFKPTNKHIGNLLSEYDKALNKAIATRTMVKQSFDLKAPDGKPALVIEGTGKTVSEDVMNPNAPITAIIVNAQGKPSFKIGEQTFDTREYREISHPAFKKWKWIASAEDGTPTLMQGRALVHPYFYDYYNNLLKPSVLRQHPASRALLQAVHFGKGTLLSMSGFHQTTVGTHGLEHRINPFNARKINLAEPDTTQLVRHGMTLADERGHNLFMEGLYSSSLTEMVPGVGNLMKNYGRYLFEDYIPRLKNEMAHAALKRNRELYKDKMGEDEIYRITARQANAAFGELDRIMPKQKVIGEGVTARSKTTEDIMRLMLLAPDFLEARMQFVGQALKPYGQGMKGIVTNEQMKALVLGALGLYGTTRIANLVLTGNAKLEDWKDPFSITVGDYKITPRTVQGDVVHLLSNPRNFVYNRLNPTLTRPTIEALTQRDNYGHYRTATEEVQDFFASHMPIPTQGLTDPQRKIWQSALASIGVNVYQNKTSFERALQQQRSREMVYTMPRKDRERVNLVHSYADKIREYYKNGEQPSIKIANEIIEEIKKGKLYEEDKTKIADQVMGDRIANLIKTMSAESILELWDKADEGEKDKYLPDMAKKLRNLAKNHPERFDKIIEAKPAQDIINRIKAIYQVNPDVIKGEEVE